MEGEDIAKTIRISKFIRIIFLVRLRYYFSRQSISRCSCSNRLKHVKHQNKISDKVMSKQTYLVEPISKSYCIMPLFLSQLNVCRHSLEGLVVKIRQLIQLIFQVLGYCCSPLYIKFNRDISNVLTYTVQKSKAKKRKRI